MKNQKGDRSPQVPLLYSPMGSGGIPETPRIKVYLWDISIKNAPRGKCALRCAVSAIIVGTGVLDCPLSEINVRSRYPKNQPILLPNIKNAAIGGIMKKS